jgi:translation initiation factor SUI1
MSRKIFDTDKEDTNFLQERKNIIISIQQRKAKKSLTKIKGLEEEADQKKIIKDLQKILQTSGYIDADEKLIVFQGDHRIEIVNYLIKNNLAILENIKIRGY